MTALLHARQVLPTPDRVYVERIVAGDGRSLRALQRRYERTAYAVAYGILLNPEAADRVVADAFDETARSASSFLRRNESFPSWLARVTRRRARARIAAREINQPPVKH